ncbi:Hypothetical protein R9X50_00719300 [Acrodontium crateriforme]|uniref:Uncharacterized protein n=1 Tax=Acrodontium crateriforme TaxID=150365 RepID=A0AAQ3RAJ7_9PEZI|nr:Hypothetical protein R9X50_00719300 [Acrodontium crateriforme]
MPFTDGASTISGRNSRASNVSGMTGASRSVRSAFPHTGHPQDAMSSAGVLSMLRTSTDTGDIGALSFNHSRLPTMPRGAHLKRGHMSSTSDSQSHRPVTSHHHYAHSHTSRISDTTSYQHRGSFTSLHSMPPSLQPVRTHPLPLHGAQQALDRPRDSRSYSLTSAPVGELLARHRSATSLKSAGYELRHGHHLHPADAPPMPDNRPPYVYPACLKRPGYRSPSPALSDMSNQGLPPMPPPGLRRPRISMPKPRPPLQPYHSDFVAEYNEEPRYSNPHPPRAPTNPPPMLYDQAPRGYRHSPPKGMTNMQIGPNLPPHHMPYSGPHYGQRPAYPPYDPQLHEGNQLPSNRGPPPVSSMAAMGHSIFQNAARMARQLPPRANTPIIDSGPPSSEPPSSSTAPTSSNPPTPKDQTTIQVAVDPLFIDPALTDLPDSSSEPLLPGTKYFQFAEGISKPIDDQEVEFHHHPSAPTTGLVQRVKAMLESRAAIEAAEIPEPAREGKSFQNQIMSDPDVAFADLHELSANQTPRFTVIEEYHAPVELPASPIRLPELSATPLVPRHITRTLIKAELAPSDSPPTNGDIHNDDYDEDGNAAVDMDHREDAVTKSIAPSNSAIYDRSRPTSVAESTATASPTTLKVSGIDYALRFSVPVDTTSTTDGTNSQNPFMLDADTLTLQHQRSHDRIGASISRLSSGKLSVSEASHVVSKPVSPVKPDEDITRSSAVSPVHEEKICLPDLPRGNHRMNEEEVHDANDTTLLRLYGKNDEQLSETPRALKTYSKSVQLPQASPALNDTPSSNRMSLPPDFSSMGDTTVNTTSEMITDVAFRFSLPTTTISVGNPQIITIPPSSSPNREESPQLQPRLVALDPKSARRSSVTFADQVAPLNIKKPELRRDTQSSEPVPTIIKSIIRRPSLLEDISDSSRASSMTELRISNGPASSRFAATQLPGLKEESVDGMSINEREQRLDIADSLEFSLPTRIAAVKAMQERRLQENADKVKASRAARQQNRSLAETRDLPSLNFSRMDLIDKLNEALDVRGTKSMDISRHRNVSMIFCPSPQRPQSTEALRERYASFFCKPQDFTLFDESDGEVNDTELDLKPPSLAAKSQKSKVESMRSVSRALSPEDLLNVATQINRLSIPSVNGLSTRLTELLPCLKDLHLDSVLANDEEVATTIEDIQHLGRGGQRPETVLSTRTSAGFRTLAERAEEIVQYGTHDSVAPTAETIFSVNKDLPALPGSTSVDKMSATNSSDGRQSHLSGSVSAPSELGQLPKRPAEAHLRQKSPMTEEEVLQMLPPESNPIARGMKQALMLSGASTRPWNQDENYPWSGTNIAMDLTISSGNATRDSLNSQTLHGRRTKSLDITTSFDDTRGIDIGSITTNLDCSSITTEQATGVKTHTRKLSTRSIIGSLSRKIGLVHRSDKSGTPRKLTSPAVRSQEILPHKVGERYPTSSLTPPAAFNLDEVRSFFSDDSSERQRNSLFRMRLTGLKNHNNSHKNRSVRIEGAVDRTLEEETGYDAGSMAAECLAAPSSAQNYDGVGMGKAEFRIKRIGEKLRHLIARGSDLIRSLSARSRVGRPERVRDDWLSDSVYSGV